MTIGELIEMLTHFNTNEKVYFELFGTDSELEVYEIDGYASGVFIDLKEKE